MSNDWLQNGNCPIAKSYRAVGSVLPLVAKVLQPPSGIKYKCPPAIVAARSALAKTAFAKNLRPQPLPAKVLVIGMLGMAANVPLGIWREHTEKFSPSWFVAVHAAVPFIGMLRKSVLMPKAAMAFTIGASILGQVIGSRAERYRLKTIALRKSEFAEASIIGRKSEFAEASIIGKKSEFAEASIIGAKEISGIGGGLCRENGEWGSNSVQVTAASSPTAEVY